MDLGNEKHYPDTGDPPGSEDVPLYPPQGDWSVTRRAVRTSSQVEPPMELRPPRLELDRAGAQSLSQQAMRLVLRGASLSFPLHALAQGCQPEQILQAEAVIQQKAARHFEVLSEYDPPQLAAYLRARHEQETSSCRSLAEESAVLLRDAIFGQDRNKLRAWILMSFPSLEGSYESTFLQELLKPDSRLFKRLFGARYRHNIQPSFTFEQLLVLGFLAQKDRTLDFEELDSWLKTFYPWFARDGARTTRSYLDDSTTPKLLEREIENFFAEVSRCDENNFASVDAGSRNRGDAYTHAHEGRVWFLRPGRENFIFEDLYDKNVNRFWKHQPSYQEGQTKVLMDLPPELIYNIFRYYVRIPTTTVHSWNSQLYAKVPLRIWTSFSRLESRNGAHWRKLPPIGNLMPLIRNHKWFDSIRKAFFQENTIQLEDYAVTWLQSLPPNILPFVNNVKLDLAPWFLSRHRKDPLIQPGLDLLGQSECLTTLTLNLTVGKLSVNSSGHIKDIPGLSTLKRFRGVKNLTIITDEPIEGVETLRRRMMQDKKHPRAQPQALQEKPRTISTLANMSWPELQELAKKYYPNRDIDQERKSRPKLTKKDLAISLFDNQAECYADSDDDVDKLRGTTRRPVLASSSSGKQSADHDDSDDDSGE